MSTRLAAVDEGEGEYRPFEPSAELNALVQRKLAALDDALGLLPRAEPAFVHWPALSSEVCARQALRQRDPTQPPVMIGRYELIRQIGEGGFGTVYKARDSELDRVVALKLCPLKRAGVEALLQREARAPARLDHAHIIPVYDAGRWEYEGEKAFFIVTRYVESASLREYVAEREDPCEELLDILLEVGEAVAFAHANKVIHGDLKPANVIVDKHTKHPYIVDFGLARIVGADVETLTRGGTLPFMAKELHAGAERDERTDQYAFCVMVWRCLDRSYPYNGRNTEEMIADMEIGEPLVRPHAPMPEPIREVLRVGLRHEPRARFASMRELLDALARARGPRLVEGVVLEPSAGEGEAQPRPRLTVVEGLMGGFVLLLAVGAVLALARGLSTRAVSEAQLDRITEARRELDRAEEALRAGHDHVGYTAWDDARPILMAKHPAEAGRRSIELAKMMAEIRPKQVTPAWMSATGAKAYEQAALAEDSTQKRAEWWEQAAKARGQAAEFFRDAGAITDAKMQEDCRENNEAGQPCQPTAQQ